jgi:hypothetical protein
MVKKRIRKKAALKIPSQPKSPDASKAPVETDEEGGPDYGGLPNRNLKKNLGCG